MSSRFETSVPFHTYKRRAKTPSFSSILLDAIYRSIDDDDHHDHGGDYPRTTPTSPTQRDCEINSSKLVQRRTKMRSDSTLETVDLRRAGIIESWMEKHPHHHQQQQQTPQSQPQKKHFLGDVLDQKVRIIRHKSVPNSRAPPSHNTSSLCFTNLAQRSSRDNQSSSRIFTKTKSRALKIYGELKKSKNQNPPISPGRRIAAFLNSIFRNNNNNSLPRTTSSENPPPPVAAATTTTSSNSTCSTASSFSRSCLSNKTSSSSSKSTPATTTTTKRSVRFYPVSVILDEDSRPCGHKSLHKNHHANEGFKKLVSPRTVSIVDGVEQQKCRREKEIDALMMMIKANCGDTVRRHVSRFEDNEDDDDDDGSCASSDLFELENLSSVGVVSRYCEELPVYGTTSLKNLTA